MFTEELENRVLDEIRSHNMIRQGESVTLAVSGGADSICLFCVLKALADRTGAFRVRVVTVEHGIRGDSSLSDAEFTEKTAVKAGVPCRIVHVDAPAYSREHKVSEEEAARRLRYKALKDAAGAGGVIATAHHAEDNAETVLFNLVRGTGMRGLRGILPVSEQDGVRIIRPFLTLTRSEIEQYLNTIGQSWCTDETNDSLDHDRNRLRKNVIPELIQINSQAVRHIGEAAEDISETYAEQESRDRETLSRITTSGSAGRKDNKSRILCAELSEMTDAMQRRLIMMWLRDNLASMRDVSLIHVRAVQKLITSQAGSSTDLPGRVRISRDYESLYIAGGTGKTITTTAEADHQKAPDTDRTNENPLEIVIPRIALNETYSVSTDSYELRLTVIAAVDDFMDKIPQKNYDKWLDYDKISDVIAVRNRRPGDMISIGMPDGMHSVRVKDFMIKEKIPRDERDSITLLADGADIIWMVGRRIGEKYKVTPRTRNILVVSAWRND